MTAHMNIRGTVQSLPIQDGSTVTFRLRSAGDFFFIVRLEPSWQLRDLLFLDIGQTVTITGYPEDPASCRIIAQHITICGYPAIRKDASRYDS